MTALEEDVCNVKTDKELRDWLITRIHMELLQKKGMKSNGKVGNIINKQFTESRHSIG